jgi:hypothetical protein
VIPESCLAAYDDPRLARGDLKIWKCALQSLSFYEPRPFKVRSVSRTTGVHFAHVAASVRRLAAAGYLERGPKDGGVRTYLLRVSPGRRVA